MIQTCSDRPKNFLSYDFIIKGKVGRGRRPSLSFLGRHVVFIISSSSRLSGGVFWSLGSCSQAGLQTNVFYGCREHVLGIINFLGSLGRMWVLYHHCFIVWGHVLGYCCMVLLLSKPAWSCGQANLLSQVIINLQGCPIFFTFSPVVGLTI